MPWTFVGIALSCLGVFVCFDTSPSHCNSAWPGTHCVPQAALELTMKPRLASNPQQSSCLHPSGVSLIILN